MLCRTEDGKGFILNPYYRECYYTKRAMRRRKLFKTGVFRVINDNGWFSLWIRGKFVNSWSVHDTDHLNQAVDIITTAFYVYEALCDIRFDNMVRSKHGVDQ